MMKNYRFLALFFIVILLNACTEHGTLKEYFTLHGLSYPIDISGLQIEKIKRVGIEENEMFQQGVREYIGNGLLFSKEYFRKQDFHTYRPPCKAMVVDNPVLFRDESGVVGLMVRTVAYGEERMSDEINRVEYLDSSRRLWKVENFAYFGYDYEYRRWNFKGWIY
jgi:hypothetical protein